MRINNSKTKQSRARYALLFAFYAMSAGCGPQGEIVQNIHPPHQVYLERKTSAKLSENPTTQTSMDHGLPEGCVTSKPVNSKFCVTCRSDDWLIARCYPYNGDVDPSSRCQYNSESVKCLVINPPFALSMPRRASQEKFLRENFLVWQRTLHSIWDDKLSGPDKGDLENIVKLMDKGTLWLSQDRPDAPSDDELKQVLSFLPGKIESHVQNAKAIFRDLQTERLEGKLKIGSLLEKISAFMEKAQADPEALAVLKSLNTQGLDE